MRWTIALGLLVLALPCLANTTETAVRPAAKPVQNRYFEDVPRTDSAYDCTAAWARHTGLSVGYTGGSFGGKRLMTRYEFAVTAARLVPQLEQIARKAERDGKAPEQAFTRQEFACLRQMLAAFRPELEALKVDIAKTLTDLDEYERVLVPGGPAAPFFRDVPRDHWAYDAVQTLAARGLMIGYPEMR